MTTHSDEGTVFTARKFTDWATVKESILSKKVGASFLLAPMAMQLVADGVPVKIVYLGHRDGSALVVGKDSPIQSFEDLRGKVVAVPNRFANQNLLLRKLMRERGMPFDSIETRDVPPPEHPTALQAGAVDAFIVGEPFCAKAEMDGVGRVLYHTKDIWPGFISCVLVVHQDFLDEQPELIAELVSGISKSGLWLDESMDNRFDASHVVGKHFYFQKPQLLQWVLSKPVDRVSYGDLKPIRANFDEIMELAFETGILPRRLSFEEYVDPSFVPVGERSAWGVEAESLREEAARLRLEPGTAPDLEKPELKRGAQ